MWRGWQAVTVRVEEGKRLIGPQRFSAARQVPSGTRAIAWEATDRPWPGGPLGGVPLLARTAHQLLHPPSVISHATHPHPWR
jgi:hypothetical protein